MAARSRIFAGVAEIVEKAAYEASASLTGKGVKHALIGRLAVNAYARSAATTDVDFLVPLDNPLLGPLKLRMGTTTARGVDVDLLTPPARARSVLEAAIDNANVIDGLPVLGPEFVALLKLWRGYVKDCADVVELIKHGALSVAHLRRLVERLGTVEMLKKLDQATKDARGER